jgi:hypothetical protein
MNGVVRVGTVPTLPLMRLVGKVGLVHRNNSHTLSHSPFDFVADCFEFLMLSLVKILVVLNYHCLYLIPLDLINL